MEFELEPTQVTSCERWQCPKCGAIFKKRHLGTLFHPGESVVITGVQVCGECHNQYPTAVVYGGKYDIDLPDAPRSFLGKLLGRKKSQKPSRPSSQSITAFGTPEELSKIAGREYMRPRRTERSTDHSQAGNEVTDPVQVCCKRGKHLLDQKQYDEAEACFSIAIEIAPDLASAYDGRGLAFAYRNLYEEAISDYTRAVELDPTYVEAFVHRAVVYHRLNRYEAALADFEQAIEIDPSHENARWGKVTVIAEMGDRGPGKSALSSAMRKASAASSDPLMAMASKAPLMQVGLAQMAFMQANSLDDMRKIIDDFPFMIEPEFERLMVHKVVGPKPQFQQHLSWLRHVAKERR